MSAFSSGNTFRHSRAFLVAIDDYAHGIPKLETPVADAAELARVLEFDHGFESEVIANERATFDGLRSLLAELPNRVSPDDRVFFYFAGHGIALGSDSGPKGYLLPQDAGQDPPSRYLPMLDMQSALSALPCRHMLVVLDCCFAGAFRWATARSVVLAPEDLHQERYAWYIRDPAWQAIASAAHDQEALDVVSGEVLGARGQAGSRHSPFAQALIGGLAGAADRRRADGTGDGVITATELYLYLDEQLMPPPGSDQRSQTPILWLLPKHDKGQFVFLVPGRELNLPPAPPLDPDANPWRGLNSYESAHSNLFFGRRTASENLVKRVLAERFVVVIGPSGIGKSSLVQAGLLPRLPERIRPIVVRPSKPGPTPTASLALALRNAGFELDEQTLSASSDALAALVNARAADDELLLVIDQAEELITMSPDARRPARFLALIASALDRCEHLRVVFTVRSEFEPQFVESPLCARWIAARYLVPQMTQDELHRVIEGPAAIKVIRFESDELIEELVNEVVQMPGALPLLSFALSEMYKHYLQRRSADRALTREDYDALQGGVTGALRVRANAIVDDVDDAHRATARRVLERLVSVESGEFARRQVRRREFEAKDPEENARVYNVLDQLVESRLAVSDEIGDEPRIELAHDAIIFGWDRLFTWLREDASRIADLRRLSPDADQWAKLPKQSSLLWDDPARIATIKLLQNIAFPGLNKTETQFADASIKRARRNQIVRWGAIAGLTVVTIVAVLAAFYAQTRQLIAVSRQLSAEAVNMEHSQYDLSLLLSLEATATRQTLEARRALFLRFGEVQRLRTILHLSGNELGKTIRCALFVPSGDKVLAGVSDGSIFMWDVKTGIREESALRAPTPNSAIVDMAISSDGAVLAAGTDEGEVLLFELSTHQQRSSIYRTAQTLTLSGIASLTFIDRRLLAIGRDNGRLEIWDIENNRIQGSPFGDEFSTSANPHRMGVQALRYAKRLGLLVSGYGGDVVNPTTTQPHVALWQVGLNAVLHNRFVLDVKGLGGLAVDDANSRLAWARDDGAIGLYDIVSEKMQPALPAAKAIPARRLLFSNDGKLLAAGYADGEVVLYDIRAAKPSGKPLVIDSRSLETVAFSQDDRLLVVGGAGGTIGIWQIRDDEAETALDPGPAPVKLLVHSRDQKWLAGATSAGDIAIWNLNSGKVVTHTLGVQTAIAQLGAGRGDSNFMAFSAQGTRFQCDSTRCTQLGPSHPNEASWYGQALDDGSWIEGLARLDSLQRCTEDACRKLNLVISDDRQFFPRMVAFSPASGDYAISDMSRVYVCRRRACDGLATDGFLTSLYVSTLAFSPFGDTLAIGSSDGRVAFVNVSTRLEVGLPVRAHGDAPVNQLAFSSDGLTMASGGRDGTVVLWDVTERQEIGKIADQPTALSQVWGLSFLKDDARVVVSYTDHGPVLRSVALRAVTQWACRISNRALTTSERIRYLGQDVERTPCPVVDRR
jgi:WD40 repeat protein